MMFSEGIPLPVKVIASAPPLMYGVMLFLATGTPRVWLGVIPVVFVLVFALMPYRERSRARSGRLERRVGRAGH
jgi:hypothetical protein